MADVLTKYSQTQSLEGKRPSTLDGLVSTNLGDARAPYSYADWIQRNVGIVPGKEMEQYNEYILNWYEQRDIDNAMLQASVKDDYIALIKQLSLVFRDEAEKSWASDIDFNDNLDLEQVIPFYARKLKEVAIYLINKRQAIKRAKLKYNTVGSREGLERLFYEYLLKAFTKKRFPGNEYLTNVVELSVFNALPELSAASPRFQIFVEELYDDAVYFDRDPSLSASNYFDLTSFNVSSYFETTFGITNPETIEWLYDTGVSQLCCDNPLFWTIDDVINQYKNGIPISAVESPENFLLNDYNKISLAKKYIGENQYFVSGGCFELWTQKLTYNFEQGNNWFYWVTGEYPFENKRNYTLDPLPLTSTNLANVGTAGTNYYESDVIFASRGNSISGAWLRLTNQLSSTPTMSAKLLQGTYEFVYPYPGYGVSGEYLDWTGRQFNNLDFTFYYLNEDVQRDVQNLYWSTNVGSLSTFTAVKLQDTTLVESGALAGRKFDEADQVVIRRSGLRDSVNNGIYNGTQEYAWLYKMEKTDIPVKSGQNYVYWPFARTEDTIPMLALSSQCAPVALSSIDIRNSLLGSTAGFNINTGDIIYKLKSPKGEQIEAAWLSGKNLVYPNLVRGVSQPGLTFSSTAGIYTPFIWENNVTLADTVFANVPHQQDCQYLNENLISLYKNRPSQELALNYNQWAKCSCKALFYSPLGHPGQQFNDYDGMCDFVALMPSPTANFSFGSWVGTDGKGYLQSNDFGWFKLNGKGVEPDVGWSNGNWVTNNNQSFYLSANQIYSYYRSALNRTDNTQAPYFVTKYKYNNNNQKWIKASYDNVLDNWVSDDVDTNMIIRPGDILMYDHPTTNYFTTTTLGTSANSETYEASALNILYIGSSEGSRWSDITYATTGVPVVVYWPSIIYTGGPTYMSTELAQINWAVNTPYGRYEANNSHPALPFKFVTSQTGVYTLTATGFVNILSAGAGTLSSISFNVLSAVETAGSNGYNIGSFNSFIPAVTCVEAQLTQTFPTIIDNFTQNTINFSVNVDLSGWNYTTNSYDVTSRGAKPYWAKATDAGTAETKFKGINVWGGAVVPVDNYNFVSQPDYSDIILNQDIYIQYKRNTNNQLIWIQPLILTHEVIQKHWCKLEIDTNATVNLSGILSNNIKNLIISGTNLTPEIVFDIVEDQPLLINYFALNATTWVQEVSDSSLGLPPTGGVWLPPVSGNLVTAITPYAYLTNRHYPTYASAPYIGELYSTEDVGGYYVPRMLGTSTFLTKRMKTFFNTIDLDTSKKSRIFRNPSLYEKDRGLTETEQNNPLSAISVDSSWMKGSITEGQKAGLVVNARDHQEFTAYQTKYETIRRGTLGIRNQSDKYDPWTGDEDNTWADPVLYPPDFRKQYSIDAWYSE